MSLPQDPVSSRGYILDYVTDGVGTDGSCDVRDWKFQIGMVSPSASMALPSSFPSPPGASSPKQPLSSGTGGARVSRGLCFSVARLAAHLASPFCSSPHA